MKQELEFFDVSAIPWAPVPGLTGIEQKILAGDKASADFSRLARIQAGADFDERLAQRACTRAGRRGWCTGPFSSTEGCLVFEVRHADPHRTWRVVARTGCP